MKLFLGLVFVIVLLMWHYDGQSISGEHESQLYDPAIPSDDSSDSRHSGHETFRTIFNFCTVIAWIIGPIGSAMLLLGGFWRYSVPMKEIVKMPTLMIVAADSWLIARYFL